MFGKSMLPIEVALPPIEEKLISEIDNFNVKVITKFANKKERSIDIIYKKQISSLVEHGSAGSLRPTAVARVGQAVNFAIERFVTVGETIADDYPEIRQGMYEACKEARQAALEATGGRNTQAEPASKKQKAQKGLAGIFAKLATAARPAETKKQEFTSPKSEFISRSN